MNDKLKGIVVGIVIGALSVPAVFATVGTVTKELHYKDIKIELNGEEITPKDANGNYVEPFIIDGTTYLPVRGVADALGLDVAWNASANTVVLGSGAASGDGPTDDITKIGDVVYDAHGVKVTLTDIQETQYYYQYEFRMDNDSDYHVIFSGDNTSVDDFMVGATEGRIRFVAEPHKKAVSTMYISKSVLEQNKTGEIEKIESVAQCHMYSQENGMLEIYDGEIVIYR